ncbi:hypothetical protein HK105_203122 [Polyrhizophydium stewartii]|uniref:Transmembrane protein n=1 Tax=Polyrhizophydium stewartii TaxID=2732419 RepID=A0ABR4ND78_9FUNG
MLLSTDVRGTWTERGKTRARIVVVVAHLVLLGPEYVVGSTEFTDVVFWWWVIGISVGMVGACIIGCVQSYMIISALLRRSKTLDAKASAEHHTLLIVALAGSVCAEICGFTAFWAPLLVKFPDGSFDYTGLAAQIAVMSLGWKSLAESLALSRMFDIAPGKQRAFGFSTRVVKLVSKIPTAMSSKEQNVLEVVRHRISIMGRLPTEWLSRPLNIASFVFAAATTSGNLCVAALIVVRLLRRWTGAWPMLVLLAVLNIISAILQVLEISLTYSNTANELAMAALESIFLGLLLLGFAWIQLELYFTFQLIFSSRHEEVWTPAAKTSARIALVIEHFFLIGRQYC